MLEIGDKVKLKCGAKELYHITLLDYNTTYTIDSFMQSTKFFNQGSEFLYLKEHPTKIYTINMFEEDLTYIRKIKIMRLKEKINGSE